MPQLLDAVDPWQVGPKLRHARFQYFRGLLDSLPRPLRILDIGGTLEYWTVRAQYLPTSDVAITLFNTMAEPAPPPFESVAGDARDLSRFQDREYDIAYSNSVIEHVGIFDDQKLMAHEVMRVASRYFIQTPSRYFPIEPHFLFPGFQFLPTHVKTWLVGSFNLGFYAHSTVPKDEARRHAQTIRLLTPRELRTLFPGCTLLRERFLGLTKSYTAIGGWQ